jgi:hypothetical protein
MIDIKLFEKNCLIIKGAIIAMERSTYECEVNNLLIDLENEISKALYDLHNAEYDLRVAIKTYNEAVEMGEDY